MAPIRQAEGVVVIVPGFNSHSGYYGWVAEQLNRRRSGPPMLLTCADGRADGERFYVDKFAHYVSDVSGIIDIAKAREPGLLGHSAGGVVACLYALEN